MEISKEVQEEVARLQAEAEEAKARFQRLMQGLATGESTADETCLAFRELGAIEYDIAEIRIRSVAGVLQDVGHLGGMMSTLGLDVPVIG